LGAAFIGLIFAACGGQGSGTHQTQTDSIATNHPDTPEHLLLVPGRSAGPFALGASDSLLHQRLGKPDFSDAAMGKAVLMWYTDTGSVHPLSVFTSRDMGNDETARIQQIRITSPLFKTDRSLQVGSTLPEISKHYRVQLVETYEEKGQTYSIYDTDAGIAFELDPNDRCIAIIIHKENTDTTSYLPLRPTN